MKIVQTYSHLNGLEYLLVHKGSFGTKCVGHSIGGRQRLQTKVSKEKTMSANYFNSPIDMNRAFSGLLVERGWSESRVNYWVTKSERLIRQTLAKSANEQKTEIEAAGETPIFSYNQTGLCERPCGY